METTLLYLHLHLLQVYHHLHHRSTGHPGVVETAPATTTEEAEIGLLALAILGTNSMMTLVLAMKEERHKTQRSSLHRLLGMPVSLHRHTLLI